MIALETAAGRRQLPVTVGQHSLRAGAVQVPAERESFIDSLLSTPQLSQRRTEPIALEQVFLRGEPALKMRQRAGDKGGRMMVVALIVTMAAALPHQAAAQPWLQGSPLSGALLLAAMRCADPADCLRAFLCGGASSLTSLLPPGSGVYLDLAAMYQHSNHAPVSCPAHPPASSRQLPPAPHPPHSTALLGPNPLGAAPAPAPPQPTGCNQQSANIGGKVLTLDVNSMTYTRANQRAVPTPAACCAACEKVDGCNAWGFCSDPNGCGGQGSCKAYVAKNPKITSSLDVTRYPVQVRCGVTVVGIAVVVGWWRCCRCGWVAEVVGTARPWPSLIARSSNHPIHTQ